MKGFVTGFLKVEDRDGFPFVLLEPVEYASEVPGVGRILVPAGFHTDYASIPQILWNILPPVGRYDRAAVVHDYLYRHNGVTRKQADLVLQEAMGVLSVDGLKSKAIYLGVRAGGWVTWRRYRRADAAR